MDGSVLWMLWKAVSVHGRVVFSNTLLNLLKLLQVFTNAEVPFFGDSETIALRSDFLCTLKD